MQTPTIRKQVIFSKPFQFTRPDSVHTPGTYTLSLKKEPLDALLFGGWRLAAATLHLAHGDTTDYDFIDMQDLRQVLPRTTDQSTNPLAAPASAIAQNHRACETLQLRARSS